jgi:hypothetical protein
MISVAIKPISSRSDLRNGGLDGGRSGRNPSLLTGTSSASAAPSEPPGSCSKPERSRTKGSCVRLSLAGEPPNAQDLHQPPEQHHLPREVFFFGLAFAGRFVPAPAARAFCFFVANFSLLGSLGPVRPMLLLSPRSSVRNCILYSTVEVVLTRTGRRPRTTSPPRRPSHGCSRLRSGPGLTARAGPTISVALRPGMGPARFNSEGRTS